MEHFWLPYCYGEKMAAGRIQSPLGALPGLLLWVPKSFLFSRAGRMKPKEYQQYSRTLPLIPLSQLQTTFPHSPSTDTPSGNGKYFLQWWKILVKAISHKHRAKDLGIQGGLNHFWVIWLHIENFDCSYVFNNK